MYLNMSVYCLPLVIVEIILQKSVFHIWVIFMLFLDSVHFLNWLPGHQKLSDLNIKNGFSNWNVMLFHLRTSDLCYLV